ncbi:MAG: GDSL-type esterase/lipase family protein [Bacteroidota bacterium]
MNTFLSSLRRYTVVLFLSVALLAAQNKPIRVACVGNSITDGGGGATAYPAQLGVLLGAHYDVRNFGVGGTTLLKKGDFPYWNTVKYLDAKDFDPQIVIIKLGTNDSKPQNWTFKSEFFTDYVALVNEFRNNGRRPQIIVCRPVPVFTDGFGITGSIVKNEIIPLVDSVQKTLGTSMIDFYAAMLGHSDLFSDGIHPIAAGYTIMAQVARDSILNSPSGIIRSFSSERPSFEQGESVKLFWETTKNSAVTLNGSVVQGTDSAVVTPSQTTEYLLITNGAVKDTAKLTVKYLPPGTIKSFAAASRYLDLGYGDSTTLQWSATNGSTVTLNGTSVPASSTRVVKPVSTTTYTLRASGNLTDSSIVTVNVVESMKIDRALNRPVTASSTLRGYSPQSAVDDDSSSFWISEKLNTQWINVDLGRFVTVKKVIIRWGSVFAKSYRIDFISDSGAAKVLFSNSAGDGGIDEKDSLNGTGRFFRLLCLNKSVADTGYSVRDLRIYGFPLVPTAVRGISEQLPNEYMLSQNYPNPFNPSTLFNFQIPVRGHISLRIFDALGREVSVLVDEVKDGGSYSVQWNAEHVSSGLYFAKFSSGSYFSTKKMLLLK